MAKSVNVNHEIRAANVRVIGEGGVQLGILPLTQALSLAKGEGLDLVEVAPQLDPPVCRIMDYGKFRYQQTKKVHEAKKRRTIIQVKEVKIRPKTEEHDYQFKLKNIRKFLEKKNKTKISLMFRGREIQYQEAARKILNRINEETKDLAIVEQEPKLEGRNMTMILGPK
ncbi:MAG: translation initiation factor IF-3 [Deltaproteobacteria bacterium]|nr:translation initiation factor IF-3 [Deltaproteobacteria bacterium]